jgi:hypothetical protein
MVDSPSRLVDRNVRSPSTPLNASSSTEVISVSTSWASALGYTVMTETMGKVVSGYSRTGKRE